MSDQKRQTEKEDEGKGEHEGKGRIGGNGTNMEAKEHHRARGKVRDVEEEVRGEDECRETKVSNGTCENWEEKRRAQEEEAEEVWHEPRKEQRIVKWIDCSDDEQEGQEETAEEREERKGARRREPQKRERREKGGERRSRWV